MLPVCMLDSQKTFNSPGSCVATISKRLTVPAVESIVLKVKITSVTSSMAVGDMIALLCSLSSHTVDWMFGSSIGIYQMYKLTSVK